MLHLFHRINANPSRDRERAVPVMIGAQTAQVQFQRDGAGGVGLWQINAWSRRA